MYTIRKMVIKDYDIEEAIWQVHRMDGSDNLAWAWSRGRNSDIGMRIFGFLVIFWRFGDFVTVHTSAKE